VPVDGQDSIDFDDYANVELDHTWDGCATWIEFLNEFTEEEKERIQDGHREDGMDFLESEGWESHGCCAHIDGEIVVEKVAAASESRPLGSEPGPVDENR
jgi:hypothetical protein